MWYQGKQEQRTARGTEFLFKQPARVVSSPWPGQCVCRLDIQPRAGYCLMSPTRSHGQENQPASPPALARCEDGDALPPVSLTHCHAGSPIVQAHPCFPDAQRPQAWCQIHSPAALGSPPFCPSPLVSSRPLLVLSSCRWVLSIK